MIVDDIPMDFEQVSTFVTNFRGGGEAKMGEGIAALRVQAPVAIIKRQVHVKS